MEAAVTVKSGCVPYLAMDPRMDPARNDPRFRALIERANLGHVRRPGLP